MIENLIQQAIASTTLVRSSIARYKGRPAVFYQNAPHDKDAAWQGIQYPRLDYVVDWAYNPERRTAGALQVNIWCLNEGAIPPEDIGQAVMEELSELFLTDDSGTYCIVWNRTDSFDGIGNEPKTIGTTLSFDILAFPIQESGSPDPIRSLMAWAKKAQPQVTVIGQDAMSPIWRATDIHPALYIRSAGQSSPMRPSNAVTWVGAQLVGHLIAPTPTQRQQWLRSLANELSIYAEVLMDDGSPMFVKGLTYNTAANPLLQGQLNITVEYGVLRKYPQSPPLTKIIIGG